MLLRSGGLFTRDRIVAWAAILIVLECLTTMFFVAGTHGWIVPLDTPTSTDFISFYAAGTLAQDGVPAQAYDPQALYAMQQHLIAPGVGEQKFFYPPVYLMLCALLPLLPYLGALAVFELITAAGFLLAMRRIAGAWDRAWVLPLIAFPATFWTASIGQNAFLSAGLFACGTALLRRRPVLAGLVLGALCFKPHFGLLLPVALIAGRHWRTIFGAAVSVTGLMLTSGLVLGGESWRAFLVAFHRAGDTFEVGGIPYAALVSVYAAGRTLGLSIPTSYSLQGASALLATAAVATLWRSNASHEVKAAALIAGTLLSVPAVLFYDLLLASVAAAWLIKEGRANGFLAYETALLAAGFAVPILSRPLAMGPHIPIGPLLPACLMALCLIRLVRGWRRPMQPAAPVSAFNREFISAVVS